MTRRIAITGANIGIGLRAATALAGAGHQVLALCRDLDRARAAYAGLPEDQQARIEPVELDLAAPASIRAAAEQIVAAGPLDALINNAAVFDQSVRTARITAAGHELFWATNHLGPVELTARLSPALAAAPQPRVVFVASKGLVTMPRLAIRFEELDQPTWFTPTRAYYHAKLAQVMTAVTLAERVGDVLDVSCLRVPAVRLDPVRLAAQPRLLRALYAPKNHLAARPEQIAGVYAQLVLAAPRHARGADSYVDERLHPVPLPRAARNAAQRDRLWAVTQVAIGDPPWAWTDAGVPAREAPPRLGLHPARWTDERTPPMTPGHHS
ncbi:SDR family NAD(P)-dependent oxidoreductase [Granulicoccus phenolivorans]|uniref:SDR family NAD(P)-dependent oxidoreductase n=1 Tax=Granulicoccus phenolivorans TaxID=266854 RepID=UPI00040A17DD|nr:SDR family NAD(P)-dependent oxidoreductase [Granulicoccus phenolivorans]